MGFLSGVSVEREYVRDGKVTKMIVCEILDDSGKCGCALFGDYVDELNKMVNNVGDAAPIVVVQFVKIKIFRDTASLQYVINTTKISINHDIPQALSLKNSLSLRGDELVTSVRIIGTRVRPSYEEDFLRSNLKKTLTQLNDIAEEGSVVPDSGSYFCNGCARHVFSVTPRFRVKVKVTDGVGDAIFVIFDGDFQNMVKKSCSQFLTPDVVHPKGFDILKGKKFIFKVEKRLSSVALYDGDFRVKRLCDDVNIIEKFNAEGLHNTPDKSVVKGNLELSKGVVECASDAHELHSSDFVDNLIVTPLASLKSVLDKSVNSSLECINVDEDSSVPIRLESIKGKDVANSIGGILTPKGNENNCVELSDDTDVDFVEETQKFLPLGSPSHGMVNSLIKSRVSHVGSSSSVKRNLNDVFEGLEDFDIHVPLKTVKIEKEDLDVHVPLKTVKIEKE